MYPYTQVLHDTFQWITIHINPYILIAALAFPSIYVSVHCIWIVCKEVLGKFSKRPKIFIYSNDWEEQGEIFFGLPSQIGFSLSKMYNFEIGFSFGMSGVIRCFIWIGKIRFSFGFYYLIIWREFKNWLSAKTGIQVHFQKEFYFFPVWLNAISAEIGDPKIYKWGYWVRAWGKREK